MGLIMTIYVSILNDKCGSFSNNVSNTINAKNINFVFNLFNYTFVIRAMSYSGNITVTYT